MTRWNARSVIENILETLNNEELLRLCRKRGVAMGRVKADRQENLGAFYSSRIEDFVSDLHREPLVGWLQIVELPVGSTTYGLHRVRKANVHALREMVLLIATGWLPTRVGEAPLRGQPIEVVEFVDEHDGDDDELEEDDLEEEDDDDEFEEEDDDDSPPSTIQVRGWGHDGVNRIRWLDASATEEVAEEDDLDEPRVERASLERIDPWASSPEGRHDAQLADFQQEAVDRLDEHFRARGARGLLCLPTGGGKTRTSLDWLLRTFVARRQRVLWITHRVDLLDQVHEEVRGLGWLLRRERADGFSVSRFQGGHDDLSGDLVLASAQTLARRGPTRASLQRDIPLGIVVYDEAHRAIAKSTWSAISRLLGEREVPFLGLTATPFRTESGGTEKLEKNLGAPIYQRTFKDLVESRFLARPVFIRQHLRSTEGFRVSGEEKGAIERSHELTTSILGRLAREPGRNQEIVEHWLRNRAKFGKTLVFACNVEHADAMARLFQQRGVRATALHSDLPPELRQKRLQQFRESELEVLVNVGILTEGANVPDTKTVLMARPTLSTSLYTQMIGRGARGPKAVPGKTHFFVIDCVDNFDKHGFQLAGRAVATELDTTEPPTQRGPRRPETAAELRRREEHERREMALAAAWLAARGYDPKEYSFWGELAWEGSGGRASVAVFQETLPSVEEGLLLVRDALTTGRWRDAEHYGAKLQSVGALRESDWATMLRDVKETKRAPELVHVPDLQVSAEDLQVAELIGELCDVVRSAGFDVGMRRIDSEWEARPEVRQRFATAVDLKQKVFEVLSATSPAAAEPEAAPLPVDDTVARGFLSLALAVAKADSVVLPAERASSLRGVDRLYEGKSPPSTPELLATLEASDDLRLEGPAELLRDRLDWNARLVAFDWLFRVALADGVLCDQERAVLAKCTNLLGVPKDDFEERIEWHRPVAVAPAPLEGFRTCPACSATFGLEAKFCGYCGTAMIRG